MGARIVLLQAEGDVCLSLVMRCGRDNVVSPSSHYSHGTSVCEYLLITIECYFNLTKCHNPF